MNTTDAVCLVNSEWFCFVGIGIRSRDQKVRRAHLLLPLGSCLSLLVGYHKKTILSSSHHYSRFLIYFSLSL
ncbi:hypothetical protein AXX17_AT1G69610 [Arabidopsis thaliana]|uniref:Uncharacterized protein n=1 Tax=Arabidopsis thaliana TaxID=3702 RepID=A0A178W7U2_ARATH|nr:hypothetical protein AXX17_AT1G69610 [Arabidopsis thaliana]